MANLPALQDIYTESRRLTHTNTTTWVNADLLTLTNLTWLDIQRILAENAIEVFGIIAHTDLVSGQDSYAIPSDCFEIVRMEVNYDDPTDDTKWKKIGYADLANLPWEIKDALKNTSSANPVVDQFGGNFFVMPKATANLTAALRLWYIKKNTDFVGTTPSTEFVPWPINLRYEIFCHGNAYRFFLPKNDTEAAKYKALYDKDIQDMVNDLKIETVEPIKTQSTDPFNNGWM